MGSHVSRVSFTSLKTLYSPTPYQVFVAVPLAFSYHLLKFLVMPFDPKGARYDAMLNSDTEV